VLGELKIHDKEIKIDNDRNVDCLEGKWVRDSRVPSILTLRPRGCNFRVNACLPCSSDMTPESLSLSKGYVQRAGSFVLGLDLLSNGIFMSGYTRRAKSLPLFSRWLMRA
jgi:hypothetical protein